MSVTRIPIRKKIALKLYQKRKQNAAKLHELKYIMWECTLRCNLNCLHCGSDCTKDAAHPDMPARDFLTALDQVTPLVNPNDTMIVLTGGEVLLRNDLENIGINLYKRGFPWGIVTNGMLLTRPKLKALLNSGLRALTISFDGFEESHNRLRGNKKSYIRAFEAIKALSSTKGLIYDVVTCVNQKNIDELEQLKNLLIQHGVKAWRMFTIFPIGRARKHVELQLTPKQFRSLFEFIKATRKEGKIDLSYGCEGFLGNYEAEVRDAFFHCQAGIHVASVLVDGSISACPNLRANFIQGNIYKDNFAEVWQHRYQKFRDRSWTKTGLCAACEFYKYCEGNGMHLRDEQTGELLFCHLHRLQESEN